MRKLKFKDVKQSVPDHTSSKEPVFKPNFESKSFAFFLCIMNIELYMVSTDYFILNASKKSGLIHPHNCLKYDI